MSRPVLLDLFCGAGGAAMGYHRAGFDVVGVDLTAQPEYPFEFHQADAMQVLEERSWWRPIDALHASPPCQFFTTMSNRSRGKGGKADSQVDLLRPTLALLAKFDRPYVVENVVGAKAVGGHCLTLHGGMFGLRVHRPRLFWSNILLMAPRSPKSTNIVGVYGRAPDGRRLWGNAPNGLRAARGLDDARDAMGMAWASWGGIKEAIPPAYTEHIGGQLLLALASGEQETLWADAPR